MNREIDYANICKYDKKYYSHGIKLESPCRIDIMSEESMTNFKFWTGSIDKIFDISIEEPLPTAKNRGVMYVVFLDKHKLKDSENTQWIQI